MKQQKLIMKFGTLAILALALSKVEAGAQTQASLQHLEWITLGTQGGPAPNLQRSQPSNVLLVGSTPWIVDCGDGTMQRFAGAGFAPPQATTVFLSHLHVDHIAGLQGIVALHWFRGMPGSAPLTVYGPPGTDKLVGGIVQSMEPTAEIARVEQPDKWKPADSVKVVIVKGGSDFTLDGVRVRAVQNSHFDNPPGQPQANGTQSLAYRFDYQGYAIEYTGDTGPSDAVAALGQHVDLLVSEVTERGTDAGGQGRPGGRGPEFTPQARSVPLIAGEPSGTAQGRPSKRPEADQQYGAYHFEVQHLSPENAGKLAATAGAKHLVFTHLAVAVPTESVAPELIRRAKQFFKGDITVAQDLEKF